MIYRGWHNQLMFHQISLFKFKNPITLIGDTNITKPQKLIKKKNIV
jgi:hypothetical protein